MYISRKRKKLMAENAHATLTADNSAFPPPAPDKAENAHAPLAAVNSEIAQDEKEEKTPPSPDTRDGTEESIPMEDTAPRESIELRENDALPEAQVELINGEGSDLGKAPDTSDITYEEFLKANPATGILRVQAFIGRQGLPVPGAFVTVSAPFKGGEKVLYAVRTNADGVADNMILPAPDREASQVPGSNNPFAVYTVTVSHPSYRTAVYTGVPVFAGVRSIQPVAFLPQTEVG